MKKLSVAIIGGAGFLGTRLAKYLNSKNLDFNLVDKDTSPITTKPIIQADVEDYQSLEVISQSTAIINLAAAHRDDIKPLSRYDDVNIQGAENVCKCARLHNINKIIFTSSVAIFGFAPGDTDESGEPNYFNDYGRTKYLAEQVYKEWQTEDPENRCLVIVRPTVIFGEGNRGNVYNLFKQIAHGKFVMIGDGKNVKSMAYVENVAAFLEFSLSFKPGLHIYNYIDKPDYAMNTLVSEVRKMLSKSNNIGLRIPAFLGIAIGHMADFFTKITGKTLLVSSIRIKKFMSTTQFVSSVNKTGFLPPFSLKEGLARTLRYEFLEDNSDKQTFETE